jgi:hypothetical protein
LYLMALWTSRVYSNTRKDTFMGLRGVIRETLTTTNDNIE